MGNQLAPHSANHKQIDELQNACVEAPLGGGRILRTLLYKHDVGKLVVKVFNKQGESLDLKPYKQQLKNIHERLKCITRPHVWPFQEFVETENTGFMIRPFIFQNLYDRICSRPFLTHIEKCWVAYQLLDALVQCHSQGVCHGDIKSENALVTSWSWVFLADFASYKPTYLPVDNPADFSYFFDIAGERRCHVAPERFFEAKSRPQGELTPAMDIFSLGCVIAELFLDGKGLFEFSELHSYKKGQFDPKTKLAPVEVNVRELILHMIQLDPKSRLTSSEYLTRFTPRIFPEYFSRALSPFFGSLLFKDPDARIAILNDQFLHLKHQMMMIEQPEDEATALEANTLQRRIASGTLATQEVVYDPDSLHGKPYTISDVNDSELLEQVEQLESRISELQGTLHQISQNPDLTDWIPVDQKSTRKSRSPPISHSIPHSSQEDAPIDGMVLLLVLLCSQLRCVKLMETKRTALFLLSKISELCRTECRLDRVLPYFLSMLSESAASIRFLTVHHLLRLLSSVRSATGAVQLQYERRLYQDYILPSLSYLPTDAEEIVRVEYAASLPELTICAYYYLHKELSHKKGDQEHKEERELPFLRDKIVKEIHELISGAKSTSNTRQALSQSVSKLAKFYGVKKIPDMLLLLTTFMNDPDWQLRSAFFDSVRTIEEKPPMRSLQILKPSLETGLQDKDPTIVSSALSLATHLCHSLNPKKEIILSIARLATPLLSHTSIAVRAKTMEFLRVVSNSLSPSDSFARLLPMTKGLLPQDPFILNSEQLILESLLIQDPQGDNEQTTPRSQKSVDRSERSYSSRLVGHDEDYLFPKTAAFSTRLDVSLIQRGLTRHKASLEKVAQTDTSMNRLHPEQLQDVRSVSALMNFELCRVSVKHGNVDINNPVGASASSSIPHGGGPHTSYNAIADAMNTRMSENHFSINSIDGWKPEGILLAHYAEHRRCINQICVSKDPNNPFFVTASNDGTVKVWDLKLLNDDLNFASCATYAAQKGEILSVSVCDDGRSVASASGNGTLHVWRVNYQHKSNNGVNSSTLEQFAGISNRQEVAPEEGAILNVQQWGALLLYTTQRGVIHAWDLRMKDDAWRIKTTSKEGLIRSLGVDPINGGTWIVSGSSHGVLTLWDVRFQLPVKKWTHPSRNEVLKVAACRSGLDQMRSMAIKSSGPFVYVVCASANEVGLWDVQDGSCKQVFRAISREETEVKKMELPSALASSRRDSPGATQIQHEVESRYQKLRLSHSPNEGIRCVLPIGGGSVITGGYDKFVRVWDGIDSKRSFPMSGPSPPNIKEQGIYSFQYSRNFEQGVPIINECCLRSHYHHLSHEGFSRKQNSNHEDCVTDLSIAQVREPLLISSSRDGIVKIWK